MLDLIKTAETISKLNASTLLRKVLKRVDVQTFIINLNTEDQLKKRNENALGVKLYQIGGEYSVETLIIKGVSNPKRVTLYDTGDYYESFAVIPLANGDFEIQSNTTIHGDDLKDRWGKEIEGLNKINMVKVDLFIQEKVIEEIESLL
jgi:hypothetical protein